MPLKENCRFPISATSSHPHFRILNSRSSPIKNSTEDHDHDTASHTKLHAAAGESLAAGGIKTVGSRPLCFRHCLAGTGSQDQPVDQKNTAAECGRSAGQGR